MSLFKRWKGKKKETVREAIAEAGPSDTTDQKYGYHILLEDPEHDKVDIVLVHGLTGDRVSTWTAKPQKNGDRGVFWPLDLLPKSIRNARIMAFGYDADVVNFWKPASQNRIFDHAKALSGALGNIRESTDTMERPIIFIGHSLGGLVIEDCLLNSNTSHEDYIREILRSTAAIAFLGTPHGGSNQAEMAIIGANFLKLFTNPNKDILKSLTSGSEALARIQQDFHRVINGLPDSRKIKITCFYEELPVKGVGEIVPKNSAILPAYSNYPLHANHMDMAKFSDPKDQGYVAVTNEIGRWIREELKRNRTASGALGSQSYVASAYGVGQRAEEPTSDRREYSNSRVDQVKKELYLSDPAYDKEEIVAHKGKRSDGTCEWILNTPEYKSWFNNPESSLLHLSGSPGKGKTVFSIFLIDCLNSQLKPNNTSSETPEAILVYYFCDNKNNIRNTAVCIMRAVLFQMLQRRPELLKYIENDEKYKLGGAQLFASFLNLWRIFFGMLKDQNIPTLYIIIDGLDECDESSRAFFLGHIRTLFQDPKDVSVKFIITSRNYPLICEVLTRFVKIDLDLKTEKLQNDVFRFIDSEIEHLSQEKPYMDIEEVRNTLKAKADGTFLWVALVLKELRKDITSEAIKARLRTLPHGLYGIYQRLLDEIPQSSHKHAKQILIWVTFAKQPLNIKGLATALSFASDLRQSAHEFEQTLKDFIRVCSSLVHEQHGIINLVHQSAKDFMLQEFGRDTQTWYRCPPGEVEKYLTKICFNYVEKTPFGVGNVSYSTQPQLTPSSKDDPFLSYAIMFWTAHAKQSVETIDQVFDLKSPFFNHNSTVRNLWLKAIQEPALPSLVHIACKFGITSLLRMLIDSGRDINSKNSRGETPLHLAVEGGELAAVRLLLETKKKIWDRRKFNINVQDEVDQTSTLHRGVFTRPDAIVKLLLRRKLGVDPTVKNDKGETPLHFAVQGVNNEAIVKLLLEKGVDPIARDNEGRTPLHLAALGGNGAIVKLLLKEGVNPIAKDNGGRTPLHLALYNEKGAIVKLLLEEGVDPMVKDDNKRAPLHIAARYANVAMVKLVLEKEVDLMEKDNNGCTPLHYAAIGGNVATVKLLLEEGVDPMVKDNRGCTSLHLAALGGNEAMVKLLLEKGVDPMVKDKIGNTPLHLTALYGNEKAAVQLLLEKEVDPMAKDNRGNTPLHLAAIGGGNEATVKLLLEKEVDPMAKNIEGKTPLHLAARGGDEETVKLLLEKGVDPMAKDNRGNTPLHLAAIGGGNEATVKLLLEKEVDPMAKNIEGKTPLHLAARGGDEETVKLLLEKGVDPMAKDKKGETPASLSGSKHIIKLLRTYDRSYKR